MGREAQCVCKWGETSAPVKALLESRQLIFRGAIRRKLPFADIQQVHSNKDKLAFTFQDEPVSLILDNTTAAKWAQIITTPPPTLAKKLGITSQSIVWALGTVDDSALAAALTDNANLSHAKCNLIVACINTPGDLANTLRKTTSHLAKGIPLWMVYPKVQGHAINESDIRSAARDIGLIDTKAAAVSDTLTALRFIRKE